MKNKICNLAISMCVSLAGTLGPASAVFAADPESTAAKAAVPNTLRENARLSEFEFGTDIYYFTYKEPIFDLTDKGMMYGGYAVYTVRPAEDDALNFGVIDVYQIDGRFNFGKVDYSSISGTIDNITDYTFEFRGAAGKDFYLAQQMRLTPYFGFGYRYLNDDTGGKTSSTGALGYERESRYYYLPFGGEFTGAFGDGWALEARAEYNIFLQGNQTSHLSDASPGLPDLNNKQRHGYGARGSVKLIKRTQELDYFLEPFIRYWHIQDSDATTAAGSRFIVTGLEPENESFEIGGRLGIRF